VQLVASEYLPRLVDDLVTDLVATAPAVMITGPRAAGKTTTAARHVVDIARLDRPAEAAAFRADPDAALQARPTPLLIDEWQVVPEVLGAVKRAVDADPRPGRFVITGSVRADLEDQTWPGTGRILRVPIWPLVQREIAGLSAGPGLFDRIIEHGLDGVIAPKDPPDLTGYLELATAGGMPPAVLGGDSRSRRRWYASYLDQLVTRDAAGIAEGRDPVRLRRYVDVLAENTAGLPSDAALLDAGAINARTAAGYDRLLQSLGVLDIVPAWSTNRLKRLTQRGKRYLTDTGLTAGALRVDAGDLLREGDLLGRMIDTYVAAQVRAEIASSDRLPGLFHLRDRDGHEVDLLLDYGRRGLIGVEIKASAAPTRADSGSLRWLQQQLPDLRAGVVLHTGARVYRLDDGIAAVPIAALWN
jgi:predicted AAA+ superfamily ATPase